MKILTNIEKSRLKLKTALLLTVCMLFLLPIYAQINSVFGPAGKGNFDKTCSLDESLTELYEKYPEKRQEALQNSINLLTKVDSVIDYKNSFPGRDPEMIIPVVFHYFYDECSVTGEELLTDERFTNALERLNNDFKGLTSESCSAPECGVSAISFKLAQIDARGNPTTGINRIISGLTNQGLSNEKTLKQKVQWPRNKYMNIYVVDIATAGGNSGLAHYPTTSHSIAERDDRHLYDGPTMASWAIDPDMTGNRAEYDYILSHEVGHWLGLRHIWGDPNDGNYNGCRCSMDDFDFFNRMVGDYGTLFDENTALNVASFNDTPNTVGFSIKEESCSIPVYACSASDCIEGSGAPYNHLSNIMDYTPCAEVFTPGQLLFMEAVLRSDISERNQLIDVSNNPFYTNNSEVRLVFEGATLYENYSNNGTFPDVLNMNLEGDIQVVFKNNLIGTELSNDYFNFNLPAGLSAKVFVKNTREAELRIEGNTTINIDSQATFSFKTGSFSPFNSSITVQNRSKTINFDFIEESGIVYYDVTSNNVVGPNANYYEPFLIQSINDIAKYYYLSFFKDESGQDVFTIGVKRNTKSAIELGMENNGNIKIFAEGQTIDAPKYEYDYYRIDDDTPGVVQTIGDFYLKGLNFSGTDEFYVAIRINTCEQPYYGWLRFKYDSDCNSLKVIDYAVKTNHSGQLNAGELDEPTISFQTPVIKNNSTGEAYEGFEIELLNTESSSLSFNTNLNYSYNIINKEPASIEFDETDMIVTRLDNYTAYVEPAGTDFWQNNKNIDFKFELEIIANGINNASTGFVRTGIVTVKLSTINSKYQEVDEIVNQVYGDWAGIRANEGEIGIQYSASGFNVFTTGGINVEFACEPNSNIVSLIDIGDEVNASLNYRKAEIGRSYSNNILYDNELYIPQNIVDNLATSTKYLAFRLFENCKVFYGFIEINLNSGGTVTFYSYHLNLTDDEQVYAGISQTESCYVCSPIVVNENNNIFYYIDNFYVNNAAQYTINGANPPIPYIDYTIPYSNDLTMPNAVLDLSATQTHGFSIKLGGNRIIDENYTGIDAKVWVDFNLNNCFEVDEAIYTVMNNADQNGNPLNIDNFLNFDYEFPLHLSGNYKMRIYAGVHQPDYENYRWETLYGEFEDHTIHFLSACEDELLYTDVLKFPSGSYGAEDIVVNPNIRSVLYRGERSKIFAEKSICIFPNTEIQYGSNFLAEIKDCDDVGNGNLRQTERVLSTTNLKVFPNPFSHQCNIAYNLDVDSKVSILISDITGKVVNTLADGEKQYEGNHQATFNAKGLTTGIYYCTLIANNKVETQKIVISN